MEKELLGKRRPAMKKERSKLKNRIKTLEEGGGVGGQERKTEGEMF